MHFLWGLKLMQTPWGPLEALDLTDSGLCLEILASEKHQLIEGLVVESYFDQLFEGVPAYLPGAALLDIDTAVVQAGERDQDWHAFVWVRDRKAATGLRRYLTALENRFQVWLVETDERLTDFFVRKWSEGKLSSQALPLSTVAAEISDRSPKWLQVSSNVRDAVRQRQSYWGFLHGLYGSNTGRRIILPRLFMNYGIQPWFRRVWNLDRIMVHGDGIWLLELKHKFPMRGPPVAFGLNVGELGLIARLGEAGVRCLHAILVKPIWSRAEGPMYLFNNVARRERAALIGVELNERLVAEMMSNSPRSSASHTTFSGQGGTDFYSLPAGRFSRYGLASYSRDALAANLADGISGAELPRVQDSWLHQLRSDA